MAFRRNEYSFILKANILFSYNGLSIDLQFSIRYVVTDTELQANGLFVVDAENQGVTKFETNIYSFTLCMVMLRRLGVNRKQNGHEFFGVETKRVLREFVLVKYRPHPCPSPSRSALGTLATSGTQEGEGQGWGL